jgi:FkbM family methyltransferase
MPKNEKLRILYWMYFFQKDKEHELFNLKHLITYKGNALDVGCNLGLWTYGLSKQKKINKIISFEPNKEITKHIDEHNNDNIRTLHYGLSNKNSKKILNVPIYKKKILNGWASFEAEKNFKKTFKKFIKIKSKIIKLDHFDFKNVSFIKIDVEGHELKLLQGAKNFFLTNKPNCLIEISRMNLARVKIFFKSLNVNYKCIPKRKFSFKFTKENFFFSINDFDKK